MTELEGKDIWEKAFERGVISIVNGKLEAIQEMMTKPTPTELVITRLEDFNSTINYIYPDDEEMYDKLRFRMFQNDCEVILFQNPEIISEIDKMYIVGNQEYDLIDYDEVDIDVRRYGDRKS